MVSENVQNEQKGSVANQEKLKSVLELLARNHAGLMLEELMKATDVSKNTLYRYEELSFINQVDKRYFINHDKGFQWLIDCDELEVRNIVIFNNARFYDTTNFAVSGTIDYITNLPQESRENLAFRIQQNPMKMLCELIEQRNAHVTLNINKLSTTTSALTFSSS